MKRILFALSMFIFVSFSSCLKDPDDSNGIVFEGTPILSSTTVSDVKYTEARLSSEILSNPKWRYEIDERGFVWSQKKSPTYTENEGMSTNGIGFGSFNYTVANLEPGKTYYVCSYAKSDNNIGYGEEAIFTTVLGIVPTVTIGNVTDISYTTANISGEVKTSGSQYAVTERGFVWSTTSNPTYNSNHGKSSNGSGIGEFTNSIADLTHNTTYYIRSYAKSEIGVGYSDEISFTTVLGIVPTVTVGNVTDISYTTAQVSANATNAGDRSITERGFVWSTTSNPTYDSNHGKSSNGSGIGEFTNNIADLTHNTTYYIRSYAKSEMGVGYSDEISFTTIEDKTITITANGVKFDMKYVEGGTFQMGDIFGGYDNEKPVHSVTLSSYYIGETEVTQALWEAVMGSNPSDSKGKNKPVETVDLYECKDFIKELNYATGKKFRLPTEAEWEYAARGGNKSKGYKYSGSNNVGAVAWYDRNSGNTTHNVKTKAANELGIYDMSGNVWEWCNDWYGSYNGNAQTNPTGATAGSYRVFRGGCWFCNESGCRVSYRDFNDPSNNSPGIGVRLVLVQ